MCGGDKKEGHSWKEEQVDRSKNKKEEEIESEISRLTDIHTDTWTVKKDKSEGQRYRESDR